MRLFIVAQAQASALSVRIDGGSDLSMRVVLSVLLSYGCSSCLAACLSAAGHTATPAHGPATNDILQLDWSRTSAAPF